MGDQELQITERGKAVIESGLSLRQAHEVLHPEPQFDMPEPTRLLIAGDWHGGQHWAVRAIKHAKKAGCDAILQVGDFGYWPAYDEFTLSQTGGCHFSSVVREAAQKTGIPVYWLDGNHENHHALVPGQGDQWLRHLPRGHRWQWWGKTWMAIGGGVSVDRYVRTPGYDWFPEETLTPQQLDYCLRPGEVDIVVAHDAPIEAKIPGIHAEEKNGERVNFFPPELIAASQEHRGLMSEIAKDKMPAYWFHGHYHSRYNDIWVDPKWTVGGPGMQVVGLDMNGTHLNLNTVILTQKDLV